MDSQLQRMQQNIAKRGLAMLIVILSAWKKKKKIERRWWERPHLGVKKRSMFGQHNLLLEMRISDTESFATIIRFRPETFDKLLRIVGPSITKNSNRKAINPSTRLFVTLRYTNKNFRNEILLYVRYLTRYLASGESLRSLAFNYRLGESTTNDIVKETLAAIYNNLKPIVLPDLTQEVWLKAAEGFLRRWNIPNCPGTLDGKHIRIKKPAKSGSEFWNFKKFFSTVMMAIADSEYKFLAADTGSQGRNNDVVVLKESGLGRKLLSETFDLPGENEIKYGPVLPHFLLGDEIFGLKPYLMVPYPGRGTGKLTYTQKIFNYRQSRGRRVIENTYGIFANVWEIFHTEIRATPEGVDRIVMAAVCLHNFRIIEKEGTEEFFPRPSALSSKNATPQLQSIDQPLYQPTNLPVASEQKRSEFVRDELAKYYTTGGRVYWQDNLIN